ncbi:MAG: Ig-like domain-containing protein [Actinoallomurus sp.]
MPLAATAGANDGATISKVEFYDDTTLLGTDTSSPYSFTWTNVPAGTTRCTPRSMTARAPPPSPRRSACTSPAAPPSSRARRPSPSSRAVPGRSA